MCLKIFIVNDCSLHNIKKKYWTPAQPVVFPQGIKRVFVGIKNQLQKKHTRTNERTHAYTPTHTRTHANSHTTWTTERKLYICKIDFILSKSENRKVEKKKNKKKMKPSGLHLVAIFHNLDIATSHYFLKLV